MPPQRVSKQRQHKALVLSCVSSTVPPRRPLFYCLGCYAMRPERHLESKQPNPPQSLRPDWETDVETSCQHKGPDVSPLLRAMPQHDNGCHILMEQVIMKGNVVRVVWNCMTNLNSICRIHEQQASLQLFMLLGLAISIKMVYGKCPQQNIAIDNDRAVWRETYGTYYQAR